MFIHINKSGFSRVIASYLLLSFLFELFAPNLLLANGGVGQTDLYSSPDGGGQMVNPATGDFSYTIPLANLDGYPLNLTYNAGIRPDQEASWVGLGWSLNPGAVTRTMRGIPDEFSGEEVIEKDMLFRKHVIEEYSLGGNIELLGKDNTSPVTPKIGLDFSLRTDNYSGPSLGVSLPVSVRANTSSILPIHTYGRETSLNLSGGVNASWGIDSRNGYSRNVGATVGVGLGLTGYNHTGGLSLNLSVGESYNSLNGQVVGSASLSPSMSYGKAQQTGRNSSASGSMGSLQIGGFSLPTSYYSFTPRINFPTKTRINAFKYKIGAELKGVFAGTHIGGTTTEMELKQTQRQEKAYGYFYSDLCEDKNGVQDLNRENDALVSEAGKSVGMPSFTYDLFSATASGLSLAFRGFRSDVGTLRDNYVVSSTIGVNTTSERGLNSFDWVEIKSGENETTTKVSNSTGKWKQHNALQGKMRFTRKENTLYENVYFKAAGDVTSRNDSYFTALGGYDALRPQIQQTGNAIHYKTTGKLERKTGDANAITVPGAGIVRDKREDRKNAILFLTAEEKQQEAIRSYKQNDFSYDASGYKEYTSIARLDHSKNFKKHPSEIKVVSSNGWRYDYGIPVYNREKTDYAFSANSGNADLDNGLVTYNANDLTGGNTNGNRFYSKTKYTNYAEAFLLTAALSPEYSDLGQDGPTPDDLGNYAKFNYSRHDANFKWRIPNTKTAYKALYDQGYRSAQAQDEKGTFVYGEKELWYLHSVETKNYVAEFHLIDRKDGHGVQGVHGGVDANEKKKALDVIKIYTLADKIASPSGAQPIREIKFNYNYELCSKNPDYEPGVGGKLTLKSLTIKENNFEAGEYRPYQFEYALNLDNDQQTYNYDFHRQSKDRWGSYKPQQTGNTALRNTEFPYADQSNLADTYAKAWNLSKIKTPAGGIITVDYESDDYGYVQDRKAMRYFKVVRLESTSGASSPVNYLHTNQGPNLRMHVDISDFAIDGNLSQNAANEKFKELYLSRVTKDGVKKTIDYLKYNFSVHVHQGSSTSEWVKGYARINPVKGSVRVAKQTGSSGGDYVYGIIDLAPMSSLTQGTSTSVSENIHPVVYMANQVGINGLSKELVPGQSNGSGISLSDFGWLVSSIKDMIAIDKKGVDRYFREKGAFKTADLSKSFVRLYEPDRIKKGGGHRVKSIKVYDNWSMMSKRGVYTEEEANYGIEYDYTKKTNNTAISSGVASYEPLIGGDENPFKVTSRELISGRPGLFGRTLLEFEEAPYGETFIPGGNVVYSEVTQHSISKPGVTINRTGKTKHEFYTAYDYPIGFKHTELETQTPNPDPTSDFFNVHRRYGLYRTQGFAVYLNDMHGKLKASSQYAEKEDVPYAYSRYHYSSIDKGILNNTVSTVNAKGVVQNKTLGVDVDFVGDTRETRNDADNISKNYNIDVVNFGSPPPYTPSNPAIPVPIPTYFQYRDTDERVARSYATTKVVQQYGILKKTETFNQGGHFEAENLLWDEATGTVVASKTTNPNDKDNPLLSYGLPAYWHYEGMGLASKNIGFSISSPLAGNQPLINADGQFHSSIASFFYPGDELLIKKHKNGTDTYEKRWVIAGNSSGNTGKFMIEKDGAFERGSENVKWIKIIRSGRRNLLGAGVGSFASTISAATTLTTSFGLPKNNLLGLTANEYSEHWQVYGKLYPTVSGKTSCLNFSKDDENCLQTKGSQVNPYLQGILGVWRSKNSHVFRKSRTYSSPTNNQLIATTNLKTGGKFNVISGNLFWNFGSTGLEKQNGAKNWIKTGEVTRVSPYGVGLETVDVNDIYQSVQLGYANTSVMAKAVNAQSREIYTDGFEDKEYYRSKYPSANDRYACNAESQEKWKAGTIFSDKAAHTGSKSLLLNSTKSTSFSTLMLKDYPLNPGTGALPYQLNSSELITGFSPRLNSGSSQKYMASFWIKSTTSDADDFAYLTSTFSVKTGCDASTDQPVALEYESPVIDGWKMVQLSFSIPATPDEANQLTFLLKNLYGADIYIDDLRVHPFEAEVNTYVYDAKYQRLVAELNGQNFTTFYQYDEEGTLISVRAETEKGIQTISESRAGVLKTN